MKKVKKIGTITFHQALNYGAVLQAFSLQNYLKSTENEAEIIDYDCEEVRKRYSFVGLKQAGSLKLFVIKNLQCFFHYPKKKKFVNFLSKFSSLGRSYKKTDISEANKDYDVIVTGSDQVWNPDNTNGDTTYLLDFADDTTKKVSYAASIGKTDNFEGFGDEGKSFVKKIDCISLREKEACDAFSKMGFDATHVVDPVFLTSADRWSEISDSSNEKISDKPFIFLYNVRLSERVFSFAKRLAKATGCRVYTTNIILKADILSAKYGFCNRSSIAPETFLKYIRNAEYVITDSFHGTSLCILFKKNFFVDLDTRKNNTNSRLMSLLSICGLEERCLGEKSIELANDTIEYDDVFKSLEPQIEASKDFLKTAIE